MRTIELKAALAGSKSIRVGQLGYGLMRLGLSQPVDVENAFKCIKLAIDSGSNLLNSGTFYPQNLEILGQFFQAHPDYASRCFLAVKGAFNPATHAADSSEERVCADLDYIEKCLGTTKKLDLYQAARVDTSIPIETTMALFKSLVQKGRFTHIGLSECGADTIRRASKVVNIAIVEQEYSAWSLDIEQNGVLDTCGQLDIPIAAYSPLGRGLFTTSWNPSKMGEKDFRKMMDRFSEENLQVNMQFADKVKALAKTHNLTPVQLCLAWLMQQPKGIICPLPGSSRPEGVQEALAAVDVHLDDATTKEMRDLVAGANVQGGRYYPRVAASLAADTKALSD